MAARQALKFITIPPRTAHKSTVIFLHGLGDSGAGWEPVAETLAPIFPSTKWILPHAPVIPVTFNYGATMPAWYDIKKLPYEEKELDVSDVWTSVSQISAIITSEAEAGLPENKIILGGFSQGCAMTLATGLTTERKLAGLICLSGRLLYETIKGSISEHSRNLPIFWGHGTADSMVTYSCGQNAVKILRELSFKNIDFKTYHGLQHGVDQDEIDDLQVWLGNHIKINRNPSLCASIAKLPSFIISLALYAAGSDADTAMSVLPALKYIIVPPRAAHTSTIIFLHGLGDTGEGWKPDVEMLAPNFPGTKWILPHARIIPVTINMQMEMSAWFDIASLTDFDNEDEKGLLSGVQAINEIITAEVDAGTPANKIILGGFSQGCALGLLTGLTTERKLAGLICLSGWLPIRKTAIASMTDHARNLPVFWGHGTKDQVVQYNWGQQSVDILQKSKFKDVTFKSYNMGHEPSSEELRDLKAWLENVFDKS